MSTEVMRNMTQDDSNPEIPYNGYIWNQPQYEDHLTGGVPSGYGYVVSSVPYSSSNWEASYGSSYEQTPPTSSVEEPFEKSQINQPYYQFESSPNYADPNGFALLQHYVATSNFNDNVEQPNYQTRIRTNLRKRERNLNINKAFDELRDRIPNLPSDTKISKIKVLRLASDYIKHLGKVLVRKESVQEPTGIDIFAERLHNTYQVEPKRKCEFEIDPDVIAIKRRKTDWSRINDEIARHQTINHGKAQDNTTLGNIRASPDTEHRFHETPPLVGDCETIYFNTDTVEISDDCLPRI
uniref:Orphan basic helix-loop-helix factor NoTlc n=1 Tax=Ciona savignyi TaxID=51511 RepID=Q76EY0_CIOSA|nr:orphan basic helix-loop-helix factor NoTlc [Ciona savignyi]